MDEQWVKLSDKYEVSSLGRVRGPRKTGYGSVGTNGYMQVCLNRVTKNVHVLVASAFLGPRPDGYHVCHIDGNKQNNVVSNLRYGTPLENWQNFRDNPQKTTHAVTRKNCPRGHKLVEPNLMQSQKARGWRSCLACSRAHAYIKNGKNKSLHSHQELADQYYLEIISENH